MALKNDLLASRRRLMCVLFNEVKLNGSDVTKELILRKVESLYPANLIKTEFLHSFFFYLDFKEHCFPEQLKKQPPEMFYKKSCF